MGNTPPSDKTMPCGPDWAPQGVKRGKVMDKESPNSCEAFDGTNVCMPLKETNHLKDAAGQA